MPGLYLALILFFMACIILCDWRFKLALWWRPARTLVLWVFGWVLLLVWDFAGIAGGAFIKGDGPWFTGIDVAPELPLEELFFLAFLTYLTLVIYGAFERLFALRDARSDEQARS